MKTALLIVCGVLYGITALLMLGAVLLQESKGGGLAALGGTRAESAFGASNPLRRLTVILSVLFFVLASVLAIALSPERSVTERVAPKKKGVEAVVPIPPGEEDKEEGKSGDTEKPDDKKPAGKAGEAGKDAAAPEKKPADK